MRRTSHVGKRDPLARRLGAVYSLGGIRGGGWVSYTLTRIAVRRGSGVIEHGNDICFRVVRARK